MASGDPQRERRRLVARGRVQGVGFRESLARRARSLGVAGFARNRADGALEAVLEGRPEAVDELLRFCRSGPRTADVQGVDVERQQPEGLSGFEVR